jgi:hypothetical protein
MLLVQVLPLELLKHLKPLPQTVLPLMVFWLELNSTAKLPTWLLLMVFPSESQATEMSVCSVPFTAFPDTSAPEEQKTLMPVYPPWTVLLDAVSPVVFPIMMPLLLSNNVLPSILLFEDPG